MIQISWVAANSVLKGKFIAIQAYLRKQENLINNLTLHLKENKKKNKKIQKVVEGKKS